MLINKLFMSHELIDCCYFLYLQSEENWDNYEEMSRWVSREETCAIIPRYVSAPSHGGVLYSFWYWWNVVWIFYEFLNIEKNLV